MNYDQSRIKSIFKQVVVMSARHFLKLFTLHKRTPYKMYVCVNTQRKFQFQNVCLIMKNFMFMRAGFSNSIYDVLRDLVPFVQFKKREKRPWKSVTFSKVTGWRSVTFSKIAGF